MNLAKDFELPVHSVNQPPMEAYMKNLFAFKGIKSLERRQLERPLLLAYKSATSTEIYDAVRILYAKNEREYQYVAIDLALRYYQRFSMDQMQLMTQLISNKAWWDSVDAWRKVYSLYLLKYPQQFDWFSHFFAGESDFWQRRVGITLQLMFKQKTNTIYLAQVIKNDSLTEEFFIQKAIGWALRDYSKTNPDWVKEFIRTHELSALAVKEGSKYL